MTEPSELTDFDALWNYDDPAASEAAFRPFLATATPGSFAQAYAELSQDAWLAEGEPERLGRLKACAGV